LLRPTASMVGVMMLLPSCWFAGYSVVTCTCVAPPEISMS
jgi:hypothetical protein